MKFDLTNPRTLATTAIMTALVVALTRYASFPNGVGGYFHLGDIAIFFTSFAFGPWAGMFAGGIGTALADVLSGTYAYFAPLSLVVHGLQGFAAGVIYRSQPNLKGLALGLVIGGLIVIFGYFLGELLPIWGGPAVAIGELPFNVIQVLVGSIGGIVYLAVERAYPRIRQSQ